MYDWHARYPEKGDRFRRAMKGVSSCKLMRESPDSGRLQAEVRRVVADKRPPHVSDSGRRRVR